MPSDDERNLSETNTLPFIRAANNGNSSYDYPTVEVSTAVCLLTPTTFVVD